MDVSAGVRHLFTGLAVSLVFQGTQATVGKWSFAEQCGGKVGTNMKAGILYLNSWDFPVSTDTCTVTIDGEWFGNTSGVHVAFSFVRFKLRDSCTDTSIQVRDVDPVSGAETSVSGLPAGEFCGHNTTLEKSSEAFYSTNNKLSISYKWSASGSGIFDPDSYYVEVHFALLYTAPCDRADSMVDPCNSARCMSPAAYCTDVFNDLCGHDAPDCDGDDDDKDGPNVWSIVTAVGVSSIGIIMITIITCIRYHKRKSVANCNNQQAVQYAPYSTKPSAAPNTTGHDVTNFGTKQPPTFDTSAYNTQYSSAFGNNPGVKP